VSTALKRVLRVVLALPAIGFLVTGLRFAVAPAGAAKGLAMPLLDGAARSSQIGDVGALFMGMGLMILTALTTLKREWFIAPAILLALVAVFRILAFLFHDAALLVDMIVAEVVIASLLVLASKKLIETE
jgi:type IV secretory pathway VirB3-like protein